MTASETIFRIIEKYQTADVFEIAERAGVKIIYDSWHTVTTGEFSAAENLISVNLRALENTTLSKRAVVAHELGHYFAQGFAFNHSEEESFACQFAAELIKE